MTFISLRGAPLVIQDGSKPIARRRPRSLATLAESARSGRASDLGRCSELIAKVGRMLTPTSSSRNAPKRLFRLMPGSPKAWKERNLQLFSPKNSPCCKKIFPSSNSPKKYLRRLSSAELDQQFEGIFEDGLSEDAPGSAADLASPIAGERLSRFSLDLMPQARSKHFFANVTGDLDETALRTSGACTELKVLQDAGNPASFNENVSRVQQKVNKLRKLNDDLMTEQLEKKGQERRAHARAQLDDLKTRAESAVGKFVLA